LLAQGLIARGGQIIAATVVPALRKHLNKEDKALVDQGALPTAIPAHWRPAQQRQKDTEATCYNLKPLVSFNEAGITAF
jgi:hypothetical protein